MARAQAKAKIACLVHRGHLHTRHIDLRGTITVIAREFRVTDGRIETKPLLTGAPLDAAHVPAVPAHVLLGMLDLEQLGLTKEYATPKVDVMQIHKTLREGRVKLHRRERTPTTVNPVTTLHDLGSLFSCSEFRLIDLAKVHLKPRSPLVL